MRVLLLIAIVAIGPIAVIAAQDAPPSSAQDSSEQNSSEQNQSAQSPRESRYGYSPQGRRDPFRSLLGTGGDPATPPRRMVDGIAGMRVDELSVRGVLQARNQLVAMVQGTDNRTYLLHEGDKVADGVVKAVVSDGLVMLQDVGDPRAAERTREVRKLLKNFEDDQR